jgi:outer membrane lipoprotein carrier protein
MRNCCQELTMSTRLTIPTLLAAALALLAPQAALAARPPEKEVVAKMQAFYDKAKDVKGKFKQVYTDSLYNRQRTSYGYLYVKKPGMLRFNYVKPERKSFIADGKVLWVHEPEDKQAFRNPLDTSTLSTALTFLLGKGDLTKEFSAEYHKGKEKLGSPDDLVLKLTPRKATVQYKHLIVAIKPGDYSVGESMLVTKHSRNHFILTKVKINTKLSSRSFRFKPPADTRVVDGSKFKRKP